MTELVKILEQNFQENDGLLLGGNWNLVMDPVLDRNDSTHNNEGALHVLQEYMDRVALCDMWRVLNPAARRYTWHRWNHHKPQASRLDIVMVPQWMVDCVHSCSIEPGFMTDHSAVVIFF